jgi:membrane protein
MIIAPVFLILSGSVTVLISTMLEEFSARIGVLNSLKPAIVFLLRFTPFFIMWTVFTLLYLVMPNTRVKFRSALVAGIIAGTIFQIVQILYINFQVGVSKYNAIYGSFAAFPLFIIWMQLSWLIVLLGAELSFANQNVHKYEFEYSSLKISDGQIRHLLLMILSLVVTRFRSGESALSATEISRRFQVPVRITREVLYRLTQASLLTEIQVEYPKERIYQPAVDPSLLTIHYVLSKIDNVGTVDLPVPKDKEFNRIAQILASFSEKIKDSEENIPLYAL